MLDTLIVGGLVVLWGWLLGKPLLAHRLGSVRRGNNSSFHRQLAALRNGGPVAPRSAPSGLRPTSRRQQAARRRQIFLALVISVVVSLLLAVAFGGVFTTLQLVMDVLLVAYVSMALVAGRSHTPRPARVVPLRTGAVLRRQPAYARVVAEG